MATPAPLWLTLSSELQASLEAAAAWRDMSIDEYARSVIEQASRMDGELAAFVQEGIAAADRGDTISQEDMEAWFEARYRSAAAE